MLEYGTSQKGIITVIRYCYIIFLLTYSTAPFATWFDNIVPIENAKYNIDKLNEAFIRLTSNNAEPLIDNITSEKVWHEWEDSKPLKSEDYVKLARFYQFDRPNTLLTDRFRKSSSIDNPRNSLDYLSQVFVTKLSKSKYTQDFFDKITMGEMNGDSKSTVFDKLDKAARETEIDGEGDKLKYAIREIRGELEKLYFVDLLKYAITQTTIDRAKNTLINIKDKELSKNIRKYLTLVDTNKNQTGLEYNYLDNPETLLDIFDFLQKGALKNSGILKDLRQIEHYSEILAQKEKINEIFEILEKFNKKRPVIEHYFTYKNGQEKNFIAAHLLPQANMLCTSNTRRISYLITDMISVRNEKYISYYDLQNTQRDGWSQGVWITSNTKKNLYSKKMPFTVESDFAAKFFLVGTDNKFKSPFMISICYGFCDSKAEKSIKSKEISNNLSSNTHVISLYSNFFINDIFVSANVNYVINQNYNHRNDTKNNIYDSESECHNITAYSELGMDFYVANKFFVKPSLVFQSCLHTEHSYYEISQNSIHGVLPLVVTARNFLNLNAGLKLLLHNKKQVHRFDVLSQIWVRCFFDVSPGDPQFDVGINYNKIRLCDKQQSKFCYDAGLQVSFTKSKLTLDLELCVKSDYTRLVKFISLVLNYHF